MRKIIAVLIMVAMLAFPASAFGVTKAQKARTVKYINHYASVYHINKKIAVAIAKLETGNFTSYAYKYRHNVGGMMGKGGLMNFKSVKAGCKAHCRNLKRNYWNYGLNTVTKISKKYCPVNTAGWVRSVKSFM